MASTSSISESVADEVLLSELLASRHDTTEQQQQQQQQKQDTNSEDLSSNEIFVTWAKEDDDDEATISASTHSSDHDRTYIEDYYSQTLKRLESRDPTLTSLELCHIMQWDLDRWQCQGEMDRESFLNDVARLLRLVPENPQIVRILFSNVPVGHPTLQTAILDLLASDERIWCEWSFEHCQDFDPRQILSACSTKIRSLRLINNHVSPNLEGWVHLGRWVASSHHLTDLRITETLQASSWGAFCGELLQHDNNKLTRMDFQSSCFDEECFFAGDASCAEAFKNLRHLRTLSFAYCGLQDYQLATILRTVSQAKALCWLDLSRNQCGWESCQALTPLMLVNQMAEDTCTLTGLTLVGCGLGDHGLELLQDPLSMQECNLQCLDISDNRITDNAMVQFAKECLSRQASLSSLSMSGNDVYERGTKALLEAVKRNPNLIDIFMDDYTQHYREIQFYTVLNRGGRRLLLQANNVPLSLWPLVLERAQHATSSRYGSTSDIRFHLLQGPALLNSFAL